MIVLDTARQVVLGLGLTVLAGCSAISSLQSAATPLNTFELTPLPAGSNAPSRGRNGLDVALPTATGALTSDRIVIKPNPLQVEALPEARWINDTTEHFQLLLVRSLANSGQFALVTGGGSGPPPDLELLTDLQAFHAEIVGEDVTVVIRTTMTLLSNLDGRVISSRRFSSTQNVADTAPELVVAAFDAAMKVHLAEVVNWLAGTPGV